MESQAWPSDQLDFSVSIILKAGQTYDFFLDGSRPTWPFTPFVHASNAALSGSPQQGADNLMLLADFKRGEVKKVIFWDAIKQSWNKSTDVNVQVFGEVLEAGSTVAALASAGGFLPAPTPNTAGARPWNPAAGTRGICSFRFGSARTHDSLGSAVPGNAIVSGLLFRSRWADRRRISNSGGLVIRSIQSDETTRCPKHTKRGCCSRLEVIRCADRPLRLPNRNQADAAPLNFVFFGCSVVLQLHSFAYVPQKV